MGTTLEFKMSGTFEPIADMVGGGPFGLEPGDWTDDTSLAICLAESLVASDGFDAQDQAERYLSWQKTGKPGPKDYCFDIGLTTSDALERFQETGNPMSGSEDPDAAGFRSVRSQSTAPEAPIFATSAPPAFRTMRRLRRSSFSSGAPVFAAAALIAVMRARFSASTRGDCWVRIPTPSLESSASALKASVKAFRSAIERHSPTPIRARSPLRLTGTKIFPGAGGPGAPPPRSG